MRSTWLILATCTACSFGGSDGPSDGPAADEKELLLDSAENFNDGSPVSANVSISAAGTVEPKAWWPGQLLVEISGGNVNFGYTTAIGLFRSLVGMALVLICNQVSKKIRGRGIV